MRNEIETKDLREYQELIRKKLIEIKELVDSSKIKMDSIYGENNIWSSPASKKNSEQFMNDYKLYLELDESFHEIINFLGPIATNYEDLNLRLMEVLEKIEHTKI